MTGATGVVRAPGAVQVTRAARVAGAARVAAVWVPDWPALAAMTALDVPVDRPAVVHDGHRVTAASAVARGRGVRIGMRRRHAQETCPDVVLLPSDPARDVRLFEPVVAATESVVHGVELARAGLLLLPAGGAARHHGSEEVLAALLVEAVAHGCGYEALVGVGDGPGVAALAARTGTLVPAGGARAFLGPLVVGSLVHVAPEGLAGSVTELAGLLARLGLRTLGDLAALPATDVRTRFGAVGAWAHRLASGADGRAPNLRRLEPDVLVEQSLDPPVDRVEGTAFAARRLAEALHETLVARGAGCGRLRITARTEAGQELVRTWRTDAALGGLAAARVTDRVRWQLEGWLSAAPVGASGAPAGTEDPEPGALVHLSLLAQDVVAAGAEQGRLWGGPSGTDVRAHRALHRVQGLLGPHAVLGAAVQGGRELRDQVHLVPWGEDRPAARPAAAPWPGRLPDPAPATVLDEPEPVELLDAEGRPVRVSARLLLSAPPAQVRRATGTGALEVRAWAGPWPVVQRWWGTAPVRSAYLQVVVRPADDDEPLLLRLAGGTWTVEARYD